jgi:hypothetical protein
MAKKYLAFMLFDTVANNGKLRKTLVEARNDLKKLAKEALTDNDEDDGHDILKSLLKEINKLKASEYTEILTDGPNATYGIFGVE